MANFNASEEELRILTDTYHEEIMQSASDPMGMKYANSEVLGDSMWEYLFDEPVLQILFYDVEDEIADTDQFYICKDTKGFATEEDNTEDMLVRMYDMSPKETANLFYLFIKDFLDASPVATPLQIKECLDFNKHIIDIMFDIDYIERMEDSAIMETYELINDNRFLPADAKEMFLF